MKSTKSTNKLTGEQYLALAKAISLIQDLYNLMNPNAIAPKMGTSKQNLQANYINKIKKGIK